ncbi:hypothetical protein AB1Y20_020852 [Prymnesium parvum]|uniref:Uncharacterized protein n=1 Tax=Prymnesium parvum TaxID=97485 RepID=A0AB34JYP4_PRYPA
MSKPKGRKRSNYGVSIYQEAPVVVQRKRKATEISIVENGVRIFGKGNTIGGAPEQAAFEQSASNPLWYNQNNMAPQPMDNRALPSQSTEGQAGYPMRRTRSHQRQMLEGYELRPTASGLSEALMMDGDYMLQHSRSQMSQLSEDASLPFRPTISGLEEVLGREFELPRDTSSLRTTRQLSNSLQFPTAAAAGTEEESRHATQRSGQPNPPMRRVRSRGGLDSSLGAGAPLQKSSSGLSGSLAVPADDDNMRITRARAHAGSNGSAEGSFHNGLPLMHSVSNMSSILANLIADEAPAAAELAGLREGGFRDGSFGSFRLTRSRTADSSNGMSRSVSGILNNLLAGDAESDNIVSELMAACGSGRATGL